MNAVTKASKGGLPATAMPVLSPPVARAVQQHQTRLYPPAPGETAGYLAPLPDPLDDAGRAEAARAAEAMERALTPVSVEQLGAWLMAINQVVVNPLDEGDFWFKAAALQLALSDQPAGAFTGETARAGMQRWKFFPTAAEIIEVTGPVARDLRRTHGFLVDFATRTPASVAAAMWSDKPTDTQKAYVARQIAELRTHMREAEREMTPVKNKPGALPLAPAALIATYEAQAAAGGPMAEAARIRLAMLRRTQGEAP